MTSVTDPDDHTITYVYETRTRFRFEHDEERRLFLLTPRGGKTEAFRDNPVRYLLVEPDAPTGRMQPVITHLVP